MPEPNQNPARYRSRAAGSEAAAAEEYAGRHRAGRHRRAHRHRQYLQPGERQQEGRTSERVADASGSAECAAGDRASRRSSSCRRSAMPRSGSASRSWPPRCSSFRQAQGVPGPEAAGAPPMTAAQRAAIYGDSPNAPQQTSNVSQAQAEAKQKALGTREAAAGRHQQRHGRDRLRASEQPPPPTAALPPCLREREEAAAEGHRRSNCRCRQQRRSPRRRRRVTAAEADGKTDPMAPYDFDTYRAGSIGSSREQS